MKSLSFTTSPSCISKLCVRRKLEIIYSNLGTLAAAFYCLPDFAGSLIRPVMFSVVCGPPSIPFLIDSSGSGSDSHSQARLPSCERKNFNNQFDQKNYERREINLCTFLFTFQGGKFLGLRTSFQL